MNPFEMVAIIVVAVMIASVLRSKYGHRHRGDREDSAQERAENLRLREEDRQSEMTVVRNEYERGENNPGQALTKEVWAAAFQAL